MAHTACSVPVTQTRDGSNFHKTTATFQHGAKTLPQRYFVSPEIFAQELEKIFATNWVLVGHQSQLAEPGDYFLAEVAGESLIVAKDQRSTFVVTAGRDFAKSKTDTPQRFSARITRGRTRWMGDCLARRTWMRRRDSTRLNIR
jgi:hypothetical protein